MNSISHANYAKRTLLVFLLLLGYLTGCLNTAQPADGDTAQPGDTEPTEEETEAPRITKFPGYDVTWNESTPSPSALFESSGLATEGLLYVFGGYYNEAIQASTRSYAFDPATQQWSNLEPMPEAVTHAGQALYKGKIYFAGGFIGDHPGPQTDHVWIYDLAADSWSAGPALPQKLGGGALVELEGRLHFFGGTFRRGDTYLGDSTHHWVLDLARNSTTWVAAAPLPKPRNHIAGAALGGKIYAIGGQFLEQEDVNTRIVQAYDPKRDSWENVARLPRPLGHISAATFVYAEQIFVVGGVTEGRHKLASVFVYDPETDTWGNVRGMDGGRSATVAGVLNGEIVLSTGNVAGGPLDTTWIGTWNNE